MDSFIIWLSAFFILLGILVWKYPKLIAGYNAMPSGEQKKVDVKGLKAFMCRTFCIIGILVFIVYQLLQLLADKETAAIVSSVTIPIYGVINLLVKAQRYGHN